MNSRDVKFGPLTRQVEIRQNSVDLKNRTAELIFSAGSPVLRYDFWSDTRYVETLSLDPSAVRLGRLNNGAPLLNAHSAGSLVDVIGVVVEGSAKIVDGLGTATVRFPDGDPDSDRVWNKVRQGILRNVSVGYEVHKYEKTEAEGGKPAALRAIDWEPYEISLVPMGADDVAKVRAAQKAEVRAIPVITTRAAAPTKEPRAMDPKSLDTRDTVDVNADGSCPDGYELVDGACTRKVETENQRDLGADQEKTRILGILSAAEAVRLPATDKIVRDLIEKKVPLVQSQAVLLDSLRAHAQDDKGPQRSVARVVSDPNANVWRGIEGALLNRIDSVAWPLDDNSKRYRTRSLMRCAEECLEQRGVRTRDLSKMEIARLAFEPMGFQTRAGLHTTSDFANILADVANKSLRRAYEAAPATWPALARRIQISDFKAVKRNQLGEAPALLKVLEHGEFTRGTIAEGKEQFQLATYGRIFGITRQALINDDLDAFGRLVTMFGRSARNLESDVVWYQILKNANMGDGVALFASGHGNISGGASVISVTSLGASRASLRMQTGLDGATLLNIVSKYLIVPPSLETVADQFTTQTTPEQSSTVNPFSGRLTVIAEPRLESGVTLDGDTVAGSASVWYLGATPDQIDMIEYGYLDGDEGPMVESRIGFDVDGLETKCRLDFAAKVIDHRGFFRNSA